MWDEKSNVSLMTKMAAMLKNAENLKRPSSPELPGQLP